MRGRAHGDVLETILKTEHAKWAQLIKESGAKVE